MKTVLFALALLSVVFAKAQTCSNGLGDPIVDINFGAGFNFGPALPPGVTNLKYVANECPKDGYYSIVNETSGCYPGSWWDVKSDHTGNADGYFMLINASYKPSIFFTQTVTGLCGNTNYQFAAWVLNMASHTGLILPDITFTIKLAGGAVLQSIETGGVPVTSPTQWNQYAFYFRTPPGVSTVVLEMANNAPGGYGNDLAIDDITFRTAGPSIGISITGHPGDTLSLCPSAANSVLFQSTVDNCYLWPRYQWQQNTGNGWSTISGAEGASYSASPTTAGNYFFRVAVAEEGNIGISACQVVSAVDSVLILPSNNPRVVLSGDTGYACNGSPAEFVAIPTGGGSAPEYQWLLNGVPAGSDDSVFIDPTPAAGDLVSVMMTSNAACQTVHTATAGPVRIQLFPVPVTSVSMAASANGVCQNSMVRFTASPVNGGTSPAYQWLINGKRVGADEETYACRTLNDNDVVNVMMQSSVPCALPEMAANPIAMDIYPIPQIELTPDTVIAGGATLRLTSTVKGPVSTYQWTPIATLDYPNVPDPLASPVGNTTYFLQVTSPEGCSSWAKERVSVFYDLTMPNAFTPNGDGRNDIFRIPSSVPVSINRFAVYNRLGAVMFMTSNPNIGWDGRVGGVAAPAGTYIWMVEFTDPVLKRSTIKKGTVFLVR